jgi:hypothetical protein
MRSRKGYNEILGVPRDATHAEVKRAYRRLAKRLHPDRLRDPEAARKAEDQLKEINAAWNEYRLLVSLGGGAMGSPPPRRAARHAAKRPPPPVVSDAERERRAREAAARVRHERDRQLDERYAAQHAQIGLAVRVALTLLLVAGAAALVAIFLLLFYSRG